jgi:phospholipid/cholesterol/gamma-HCH transport system substrate-binding protein
VIPGDITAILAAAGDMTVDAKLLLRRLDSALATVNSIVGDPALRGRINNTMANVEQTSITANRLIAGNQAAVTRTVDNLHQLSVQLKSLVDRTGVAVDKTVATAQDVTNDARRTIGKVDHTVEQADSLVAGLDKMVRDLKEGGGTASMLLYDKEFAEELQKTVKGLRAYINQIEKNGINLNVGLGRK